MKHWTFFFGVGTLFTHELDAVANYEWRVLPLVRLLPEELGMLFFITAHVPIFAVIIALVTSPRPKVQLRSRIAVSQRQRFSGRQYWSWVALFAARIPAASIIISRLPTWIVQCRRFHVGVHPLPFSI